MLSIAITTIAAAALTSVLAVSLMEQAHYVRARHTRLRDARDRLALLTARYHRLRHTSEDWAEVLDAHDEAVAAQHAFTQAQHDYEKLADTSFTAMLLSRRLDAAS